MKVKLQDPSIFAKSIDMISELVLEAKIKFNEFGLSIVAIDPSNVSMVSLKVPKSSFSEFEVEDETLGVSLDGLKKVLRRCSKSATLTLETNKNLLEIKIEDKIKRTFSLNLIEIEGEDKEFPSHLEYSSKVEINSIDLAESLEDVAVVSDACSFIIKENKFIIEAKETDSARTEFSTDISIDGEDAKSRYSLDYLQKFMKAGKSFNFANVNFANDHPLRMDFNSDTISLSFLLAPRIETDD